MAYHCNYCGYDFPTNTDLINHINLFHPGQRRTARRKAMSSWGY